MNQWILIEHSLKTWYSQEATRFDHMLFEEALVRYLEKDSANAELLIQKDLINHPGARGWQLGQLAYFNLVYGNAHEAFKYYKEALKFGVNHNYARNIAKVKFLIGLQDQGLEEINRIILDMPNNHINFLYRSEMYEILDKKENAINDLYQSLRIQKTENGLLKLADLYSTYDKDLACKNWTMAKKLFQSKQAKNQLKLHCK